MNQKATPNHDMPSPAKSDPDTSDPKARVATLVNSCQPIRRLQHFWRFNCFGHS
uniref:Uncharacterized protein n=1 Tax=Meloidogyne enterolobii TaxID=390850 RepID=A0A6V7W226_MELEN|nr:unnamed protein product [Meloidogyne enterolobii]